MCLENVKRLLHGQFTPSFEKYKKIYGKSKSLSFTIVYDDNFTLDICTPNQESFDRWFWGLHYIVDSIRYNRAKTG